MNYRAAGTHMHYHIEHGKMVKSLNQLSSLFFKRWHVPQHAAFTSQLLGLIPYFQDFINTQQKQNDSSLYYFQGKGKVGINGCCANYPNHTSQFDFLIGGLASATLKLFNRSDEQIRLTLRVFFFQLQEDSFLLNFQLCRKRTTVKYIENTQSTQKYCKTLLLLWNTKEDMFVNKQFWLSLTSIVWTKINQQEQKLFCYQNSSK